MNKLKLYSIILLAFGCNVGLATNYYIDAIEGDDSNNGTSVSSAWETLANINTTIFQPGDNILFKAGQSWTGTIKPQGSGTAENPIVIGKYGSGERPAIHGDASVNCTVEPGKTKYCTVYLYNQEYWEIRDLEITNFNSSEENGISLGQWENDNVTNYANVTKPQKYAGANSQKCGILVEANDFGEVNHLHFVNLEVHGVNGKISEKNNGGIFLKIFNFNSSDTPTYFNDVLIDNCHFHDLDRTGVSNRSDYDNRTLNRNTDWTPSKNVVISNNIFERTGANALIVRVAEDPLMENNLFDHCSIKETGNAAFNFNTDGAIWQFNEARYTKYNVGDIDAGGIDSDYRTKNTTIQYNYIHDNDFGTLITGGPSNYNAFNDRTIFRYNILENDGLLKSSGDGAWAFKISGLATNTEIYNNIIYVGSLKAYTDIVYHKSWSGWPDNTAYTNNIFFNDGSNTSFNLGSSKNNTFSNNIYYGNRYANEPSDPNKITSDPLLTNPGNGESGYQLQLGSPALAAGSRLSTTPDKDYYQNRIQRNDPIDIGIHQVSSSTAPEPLLYFSLRKDGSVGGQLVKKSDIIVFDGSNFTVLFKGDDIGLGDARINAFVVLSATEILMSLYPAISVPSQNGGILDVDPNDIVRFTPNPTGSGTFELVLDGNTAGLTQPGQQIDAISMDNSDRLLISVAKTFYSDGTKIRDEDLLASTATGSWELVFDGSDVGLETTGWDLKAAAVGEAGQFYLSMRNAFVVPQVSGANEDVFIFNSTQLGKETRGTYSSSLFFDGSAYGFTSNDISALDILYSSP